MAREWTDEQRAAISTRDKSLLVSAAAGSGKTATLTQRIIESILDERAPADISRMLIVTFTRAAVGELRERIGGAIKERLAAEPGNARLEKQLLLLPGAKIITIDSFCNECIRTFPEESGVAPGYRIADGAEILLISREVFGGVTESILRGELADRVSPDAFELLTDCLADTRRMADTFDIFREVYEKLRTTCGGTNTLREMIEDYAPERFTSPDGSIFGEYILRREREEFELRAQIFSDFAERLTADGADGNYAQTAADEAEAFTRVAKSGTFSKMREAVLGLEFGTLRSRDKTPTMTEFKDARGREKDKIAEEREHFFIFTDEDWRRSLEAIYPLMRTFLSVIEIYDAALSDRKKQLGAFDYSDIERFAYNALLKDGEPTELARSMAEQFSYVYIDEYQDINDLQDSIFRAVSREDNRFTVGDIKQSIYGFRSANPQIFAAAKRRYPRLENAKGAPAASIFMSKNFRSSEGIIDFVNGVFDKMFTLFSEGIDYKDGDRLVAARPALGESYTARPGIYIYPSASVSYTSDDSDGEDIGPAIVAERIKELLRTGHRESGAPIRPSDIAVILRSMKGKSDSYVAALESRGIPVKTGGKKSIFENSDVLLALCLLNSISNPLRDVYLTGLLRSPLFDFSADELVAVRGGEKHKPFYISLREYTESHPEFKKGTEFLTALSRWREVAEGMRTDRLLAMLFRETGLLSVASRRGQKKNLIRLYEYARSFEDSAFGGLGSFITYINNVIAESGSFECNINAADDNAVTVISAHSSKGLEYPVVFLADTGRKIKGHEGGKRFIMSVGFGAAMRHITEDGLALVENPMMNAVADRIERESFEEELRILYVAMTRAKESLYIIGAAGKSSVGEYTEKMSRARRTLTSPAAARRLDSFLDIISASTGAEPTGAELLAPDSDVALLIQKERERIASGGTEPVKISEKVNTGAAEEQESTASEDSTDGDGLFRLLCERFEYKYHSQELVSLPKKMSVSALSPTVLDGTEDTAAHIVADEYEDDDETVHVPEFICKSEREESLRRGIATHLFLQFCDLDSLAALGAERELERLVAGAYISEEDAPRVRISEIEAFAHSELFSRMRAAKRLYREFRFNTPLPAEIFTDDKERARSYKGQTVLVQGVIDCIIEEEDGSLTVVDYKTDRLSAAELSDISLAEKRLRAAHGDQLYYYCLAAERIFARAPSAAEVFSLHLGKTVDVMKKEYLKQ